RHKLVSRDAECFAKSQPRLDATGSLGRAVVVDDPLNPLPPNLDLGAVRKDRRVLKRDALLVVEAVDDPALKLVAGQLAGVHASVKRVQVVVARSLRPQASDELLRRQAVSRCERGTLGHSSNSSPS